jgi:hypothetical protein
MRPPRRNFGFRSSFTTATVICFTCTELAGVPDAEVSDFFRHARRSVTMRPRWRGVHVSTRFTVPGNVRKLVRCLRHRSPLPSAWASGAHAAAGVRHRAGAGRTAPRLHASAPPMGSRKRSVIAAPLNLQRRG